MGVPSVTVTTATFSTGIRVGSGGAFTGKTGGEEGAAEEGGGAEGAITADEVPTEVRARAGESRQRL